MEMPQGVVCWQRENSALDFRVEGWGAMQQGAAIRRWFEQNQSPAIHTWCVDLSRCTYMDSTFIGTLLYLQRMAKAAHGDFYLIRPSSECRQLLAQMGIERLFVQSDEALTANSWETLPTESISTRSIDFKQNVADAHRRLADENACGGRFAFLAAQLERELASERQPAGSQGERRQGSSPMHERRN